MTFRNDSRAWGWPARLLHWAMAGLILFMLGLGLYMTEFFARADFERFGLVQLHKSWGFVAFVLALIRLLWRAVNPAPGLPEGTPRWEATAAHASHYALYALILIMPLSGWLMASASELQETFGIRNMVFGLFALPDPFQPGDRALEDVFRTIHQVAALGLALLLTLHAAAALRHHFVKRNAVLRRMIVGR